MAEHADFGQWLASPKAQQFPTMSTGTPGKSKGGESKLKKKKKKLKLPLNRRHTPTSGSASPPTSGESDVSTIASRVSGAGSGSTSGSVRSPKTPSITSPPMPTYAPPATPTATSSSSKHRRSTARSSALSGSSLKRRATKPAPPHSPSPKPPAINSLRQRSDESSNASSHRVAPMAPPKPSARMMRRNSSDDVPSQLSPKKPTNLKHPDRKDAFIVREPSDHKLPSNRVSTSSLGANAEPTAARTKEIKVGQQVNVHSEHLQRAAASSSSSVLIATDSISSGALLFSQTNVVDFTAVMCDGFYDIGNRSKTPPLTYKELDNEHNAVVLDANNDPILHNWAEEARRLCLSTHDVSQRARLVALYATNVLGGVPALLREQPSYRPQSFKNFKLIGDVEMGGVRERALLFKYLADRVPLPNKLKRDGHDRYWNVVVINKEEHIVDLCHRPGASYIQSSDLSQFYIHTLLKSSPQAFYVENEEYDLLENERQRTMESINFSTELDFVSKIGSGSFGDVWRASLAGFTCAVKILRTGNMSAKEQSRVVSEVALLQDLDHPNIVTYLGREIRKNDDLLIMMEYVPHSLYESVRRAKKGFRRPFKKAEASHIMSNIARGLLYLHTLPTPVIHRDLKSKNVLVEWNNDEGEEVTRVKLCDFGVAKAMTESTVADSLVGTTRWMAPEVVNLIYLGKPVAYTEKADIWSLGMVMYELLELKVPYADVSQWDVKGFISRGDLPKTNASNNKDLMSLDKLMRSCLSVSPTQRPSARTFLMRLYSDVQ